MNLEHREVLLGLTRTHFARVTWTHKIHEKQRELTSSRVFWFRLTSVSSCAATVLLAVVGAVLKNDIVLWVTTGFGALSVGLSLALASFDPIRLEVEHRNIAKKLLSLRNRWEVLVERAMTSIRLDSLQADFENLLAESNTLHEFCPDTGPSAYYAASKALKMDGEMSFSDDEIDKMLPRALRTVKLENKDT